MISDTESCLQEGEFGLKEAVAEAASLKRSLKKQERKVEELIGQADSLQLQVRLSYNFLLPTSPCVGRGSNRREH